MVRASFTLLKDAMSAGFAKSLSEILVCPLSKQPLRSLSAMAGHFVCLFSVGGGGGRASFDGFGVCRFCEETNSLVSDAIGVSFPIKNGIPRLVPKDGKILGSGDDDNDEVR